MMEAPLSQFTTIAIGGSARKLVVARSQQELIDAVYAADHAAERVFILGGGSNVLMPDADPATGIGFNGTVILVENQGITAETVDASGVVILDVQAGHSWDRLVEYTVFKGWSGLEALSGIPGKVGAAPMQNIGAYGTEVNHSIASVRVWDRQQKRVRTLTSKDLEFSYRSSLLKKTTYHNDGCSSRYVVMAVRFQLKQASLSLPVRYTELAKRLNIEKGEHAPLEQLRNTVLELRAAKGMIIDRTDRDTYSTGSFFVNPTVNVRVAETLPTQLPRYPQSFRQETNGSLVPETVKLSAAWLIDNAGFHKGYGLKGTAGFHVTGGRVYVSTKHTLAIANHGPVEETTASQKDVLALKNVIEEGVESAFGVRLQPETVIVSP